MFYRFHIVLSKIDSFTVVLNRIYRIQSCYRFLFAIASHISLSLFNHFYIQHLLSTVPIHSHRDIYEVKQLRLCICDKEDVCLGLIDLFDFDPKNARVGMGIVIANPEQRNKGIGAEAISLLCDYVFSTLHLHQVYANILEDNEASINLFTKLGFEAIGTKKEWVRTSEGFKNEIMYQKLSPHVH